MVPYVFMGAMCLILGAAAYLYAQYKISKGPEDGEMPEGESADAVMKKAEARRKRFSGGLAAFCAVSILVGEVLLYEYGIGVHAFICAAASTLLLSLSLVDLAIFEIPPEYNVVIAVLGVIAIAAEPGRWLEHLIGAACVSGLFLLINLLSGGAAMGGGDVKLMAALGLLTGWKHIILVMIIGSLLGAVIHSIRMKVSGKKKVLAFGPYLAAAGVMTFIFGDMIIAWYVAMLVPEDLMSQGMIRFTGLYI